MIEDGFGVKQIIDPQETKIANIQRETATTNKQALRKETTKLPYQNKKQKFTGLTSNVNKGIRGQAVHTDKLSSSMPKMESSMAGATKQKIQMSNLTTNMAKIKIQNKITIQKQHQINLENQQKMTEDMRAKGVGGLIVGQKIQDQRHPRVVKAIEEADKNRDLSKEKPPDKDRGTQMNGIEFELTQRIQLGGLGN